MLSEEILSYYKNLSLSINSSTLSVLNPYHDQPIDIENALVEFYHKFYSDTKERGLILGINPGRKGAGATGIPFTDSKRLEEYCKIKIGELHTHEPSSVFVYKVIEEYGGPEKFYSDFFIGAVSPLGFVQKNDLGHWVNFNFYDRPSFEIKITPFIQENLKKQKELCQNPKKVVLFGSGKNLKSLQRLNDQNQLFEEIIPLEHPRYIMQYKAKSMGLFIDKYLLALEKAKPNSHSKL